MFILPTLSKEVAIKENVCLKKRRELLEEIVPGDKLKIRNLELFNDGKKVDLGDNHEEWRLGFINILLIFTRSLASLERRSEFANSVMLNDNNIICACETWLNDNISSSELLLDIYNIYRSDRKKDAENNTHGGTMIAIKNSLASEQLNTDQPYCSLTCRLEINKLCFFNSVFYNPPLGSGYRYTKEDFGTLLSDLPKTALQ